MTTADRFRKALADEGLAGPDAPAIPVQSWSNDPGDRYGEHRHEYDKVLVCEGGSIDFLLGSGERVGLAPGDRLDLPAGTGHAAAVGPAGVSCSEAHLPAGSLRVVARHAGWAPGLDARTAGRSGA